MTGEKQVTNLRGSLTEPLILLGFMNWLADCGYFVAKLKGEKMNARYAKSVDGIVHAISAINGEFTICGDAFDGPVNKIKSNELDGEDFSWKPAERGPITCEKCATEVLSLRGIRIAAALRDRLT